MELAATCPMPTYVYECSACSRVFEKEQRITEPPLDRCDCGGEGTVRRLIQPTAVMFKGAGFHINDYAPTSASPAAEKPAEKAAEATPAPAAEKAPSAD
jgi:putative FmdB family regulatory protein